MANFAAPAQNTFRRPWKGLYKCENHTTCLNTLVITKFQRRYLTVTTLFYEYACNYFLQAIVLMAVILFHYMGIMRRCCRDAHRSLSNVPININKMFYKHI